MKTEKTYKLTTPAPGETEFYKCRFEGCIFPDTADSIYEFHECVLFNIDLSSMNIDNYIFDNVTFEESRLTGVNFSRVNHFLFAVNFDRCMLDYAVFEKNNLKNSVFNKCSLKEACFIESNLKSAQFIECDLADALFERSDIENADFSTAENYFIDLNINKVKGAKFSLPEAANLLMKYNIKIV